MRTAGGIFLPASSSSFLFGVQFFSFLIEAEGRLFFGCLDVDRVVNLVPYIAARLYRCIGSVLMALCCLGEDNCLL